MILRRSDLSQSGAAGAGWTVNLHSEYDCQNLFYTVMRAWIGAVGREEITVKFDGQSKVADFNLFNSQLIVEMKFVDNDQKKREVVKTLAGLSGFYSQHANIKSLLFLIYVKNHVSLDVDRWESEYTFEAKLPKILTRAIVLP